MTEHKPADKAEVSRILHYVIENSQGIRCRPAIVVENYPELHQPGLVDVMVFPDGGMDGRYGVDDHRHGSDDNMPEASKTTRANYNIGGRLEQGVRPNHFCRAVGSWHWPRECHAIPDPINPYIDSTGLKVNHNHGLGISDAACKACQREFEEKHGRRS